MIGSDPGETRSASAAVAELLAMKPDFPQRGRILIDRCVRFPELQRRVVEGLEAGGLVLDAETP